MLPDALFGRAIAYCCSAPGTQPVWVSIRPWIEGLVLLHAVDRPERLRVVDAAELGALILLDDDPRGFCMTRLDSPMRACACGAIEVRGWHAS